MKAWEYHNRIVRERRARARPQSRRLSELPRGSERTERKRALLLEFLPVVEKYVVTGEEYRNPVLTQLMVWAFDVGDIDQAMRLARVAIAQNQPMPERYKRDVRTAVADLVMDWVESRGEQPVEPYFSEVYRAIFPEEPDVIGWQIHDEIRRLFRHVLPDEIKIRQPVLLHKPLVLALSIKGLVDSLSQL